MDHKTDEYFGILLLQIAQDARADGDLITGNLLTEAAARYFDEVDRLSERWRNFEAHLDHEISPKRTEPSRDAQHCRRLAQTAVLTPKEDNGA